MPTCIWLSIFMDQLLKVDVLERKEVAEQDSLMLLAKSRVDLFILLVKYSNFCLAWYTILFLLISTNFRTTFFA